jgi:hypothetical protein
MPLTIQSTANAGNAHMIQQTYFAFSKGRWIGTSNMFNCMGLVIHSPTQRIGCLAHIEARTTANAYLDCVADFLAQMTIAMNKESRSGPDRGMEAGLFGNAGGMANAQFSNDLKNLITGFGIQPAQITDQRNAPQHGPIVDIGANPRLNIRSGAITYSPADGLVELYSNVFVLPRHDASAVDLVIKKVQ